MLNNPLKKRFIINIILSFAIAVLMLVIWLGHNSNENQHLISEINSQDIKQIRIQQKNGIEIQIGKTNEHWEITRPVSVPASPFRINSILDIARAKHHAKYSMSNLNAAEFGLLDPLVSLSLDKNLIKFGDKDPVQGHRYTQINNTLYMLDDRYLPLLSLPLQSLINTQLLPDYYQIKEFRLPEYSVARTETGGWILIPEDKNLSSDDLQDWVNRWRRQHASQVEYQPEYQAASEPTILVQLLNDQLISLNIIRTEEWSGLYWREQQIAYKISDDALDLLLAGPRKNETDQEINESIPESAPNLD